MRAVSVLVLSLAVLSLAALAECVPVEPPRAVDSRRTLRRSAKPSLLQTQLVAIKRNKQPAPVVTSPSVTVGILAVLGGVLLHLACGTMYTWGNLISYLPPNLKYWGMAPDGGGLPDATLVLPLILVSQMTGMPFGPILESKLGPSLTAALGGLMMAAGTFLASYAGSLGTFVLSYAVLFGLGVGIVYQMPFIVGGRWFPDKKGSVTGAIITGMGASAFLFNMVQTRIVNPLGLDAEGGLFPPAVYARWPSLLRTLGCAYAVLALVGASLQRNPPWHGDKEGGTAAKPSKERGFGPTPPRALMADVLSARFALLWLMILFSSVSGLSVAAAYKTFGTTQQALNSDTYLSLVGSLSAILGNAAGRFFWGSLTDAAGFKRPYMALTLLQTALMLAYAKLAASRVAFAAATVLMLFCMGGNFAIFPAQTMRLFGPNGAQVYSFLFSGFGSAALLGPVLANFLRSKGGFALLFSTLGLLSLVSCALASTL